MALTAATFTVSPEEVLSWPYRRFLCWFLLAAEMDAESRSLDAVAHGEAVGLAWAEPQKLYDLLPDRLRNITDDAEESVQDTAEKGLATAERIRRMRKFGDAPSYAKDMTPEG